MNAISSMAGNIGGSLSGLVSGVTGFFQRKQGNRLLRDNPFPTEGMPSEVLANQQIAQSAAQQGMPSEQYMDAARKIAESQTASLNAATDRRSGVSAIGAIQQASNNAYGGLAAQSAEMRRQNRAELYSANNQVASWRDKLFDWNQRQKYLMNRQYAMSLIGAGNANLMAGADKLIGSAVGGASSGLFSGGGGQGGGGGSSPGRASFNMDMPETATPGNDPAASLPGGRMNPNAYSTLFGG